MYDPCTSFGIVDEDRFWAYDTACLSTHRTTENFYIQHHMHHEESTKYITSRLQSQEPHEHSPAINTCKLANKLAAMT